MSEERIAMLLQEGEHFEQARRFEDAIAMYLEAVKLAPDMPQTHAALANAYRMAGNRREEMMERLLALAVAKTDEEHAEAFHNLADPLAFFGPIEVAIGCLKKAVSLAPCRGLFWRNLGAYLIRERNVQEGLLALEQCRALEGESASYWWWTGKARMLLGQHQEAVAAFKCCVEHNPNLVAYWRDLAIAYVKVERYEEAKQICKTKLRSGLAAHLILANIEGRAGYFEKATVLTKHALEVMSAPADFDEVRRHYCNRKSHEELIGYVQEIIVDLPEVPWLHWILARLYSVLDNISAVKDEIREVLRLDSTLASAIENDKYFQNCTMSRHSGREK